MGDISDAKYCEQDPEHDALTQREGANMGRVIVNEHNRL